MSKNFKHFSPAKKAVFYAITLAIVIAVPLAVVFGFYAVRKLTFAYDYCGPYGQLDGELGWRLKENASSCLSLRNHLNGYTYFDSTIYTNRAGFRDSAPNKEAIPGGIATIGDSWTFGYGVNYEESFPYFLSRLSGLPVANLGIPAYSAAQTIMLFKRNVEWLKPKIVVYLSRGLHTRSMLASRSRPAGRLTPYHWWDDAHGRIELVKPAPGLVFAQAREHNYPGGYLTSGYDKLIYFFIIKPMEVMRAIRSWFGVQWSIHGIASDTPPYNQPAMFRYILDQYGQLSAEHHFTFVLVDDQGYYGPYLHAFRRHAGASLIYIGMPRGSDNMITALGRTLPKEKAWVPGDGHFGPGLNRLVAKLIHGALVQHGVVKGSSSGRDLPGNKNTVADAIIRGVLSNMEFREWAGYQGAH